MLHSPRLVCDTSAVDAAAIAIGDFVSGYAFIDCRLPRVGVVTEQVHGFARTLSSFNESVVGFWNGLVPQQVANRWTESQIIWICDQNPILCDKSRCCSILGHRSLLHYVLRHQLWRRLLYMQSSGSMFVRNSAEMFTVGQVAGKQLSEDARIVRSRFFVACD